MTRLNNLKKVAVIGLFLFVMFSSCEDKGCPDDMQECTVNGKVICVPKGKC
jgi:hypothetical protein